ncbi:MAG: sugar kinase [Candidatus Riflebacteria bacterium]|nr:sugar kinase [Candidatus Riflebacteria bacterium]
MPPADRIVVVVKKTGLEELVERFNTQAQARFYVEHMGVPFSEYEEAHRIYKESAENLRRLLPRKLKHQIVERGFLPSFSFGPRDVVVTLGPDGLVINTAKYLREQPIVALNPDASRIDGILNPFALSDFPLALAGVLEGRATIARVSMACATLNDGQRLFAVNDLFVGHRSHGSARYRIEVAGSSEDQSSSGIIVSTGAGSTGWLRAILTGAAAISRGMGGCDAEVPADQGRFDPEAEELRYFVREPFPSRTTACGVACGVLAAQETLTVTSWMPDQGTIFSDGIESDYLPFNTGAVATIGLADRKAHLVQRCR